MFNLDIKSDFLTKSQTQSILCNSYILMYTLASGDKNEEKGDNEKG